MGDQPLRQWDSAIETGRLTHGAKSGCFRPKAAFPFKTLALLR